jgi:hypothetical protein
VNLVKNCAFGVSLFALAAGFTATKANAQSAKGTFNLPFQAYWGNAVLEPGEYTISIPPASSMSPAIQVSGQGKTVMVLMGVSGRTDSEGSYLTVESIGQAHVIRELDYGATGRLIRFPVPKSARNEAASERTAQNTTVEVTPPSGN